MDEHGSLLEKLANMIIIGGTLFWLISILFLGGGWQPQLSAAGVLCIGIFVMYASEGIGKEADDEEVPE